MLREEANRTEGVTLKPHLVARERATGQARKYYYPEGSSSSPPHTHQTNRACVDAKRTSHNDSGGSDGSNGNSNSNSNSNSSSSRNSNNNNTDVHTTAHSVSPSTHTSTHTSAHTHTSAIRRRRQQPTTLTTLTTRMTSPQHLRPTRTTYTHEAS